MSGTGSVQGSQPSASIQQDTADHTTKLKVTRPSKFNRNSIAALQTSGSRKNITTPTRASQPKSKPLTEYKVSKQSAQTRLNQPRAVDEKQLAIETLELRTKITLESQKKAPLAEKRTVKRLKKQVQCLEERLNTAKQMERQSGILVRKIKKAYQLSTNDGSDKKNMPAAREAAKTAEHASKLKTERRNDLREARRELRQLEREIVQTGKIKHKAQEALSDLNGQLKKLKNASKNIGSRFDEASNKSTKELIKESKALNTALNRAKRVLSSGKKLLSSAATKSKKHGIDVAKIKNSAFTIIQKAKQETAVLKARIDYVDERLKIALEARKNKRL